MKQETAQRKITTNAMNEQQQCPKCGHQQSGGEECSSCGLIFARYELSQQKRQQRERGEQEKTQNAPGVSKGVLRVVQALLLMVVTAAGSLYFSRPRENSIEPPNRPMKNSDAVAILEQSGQPDRASSSPSALPDLSSPRPAPIENARSATVFIETPWGVGSGFFVRERYIVTNKHVVEFDKSQVEAYREKIRTNSRLIELEHQKLGEMRRQVRTMPRGPGREQLAIIIAQREKELAKIEPQINQARERLAAMDKSLQPGDIKVVLADGSEHRANSLHTSPHHDLALLSLFAEAKGILQRPPESRKLRQGEKVYAIGSPVGLQGTVTAGIFSGYRKRTADGATFLQTDAPINPGNSGGPLIDDSGFVHGVATMIVKDTEGIGFAIPVDTVFEEFRSVLF